MLSLPRFPGFLALSLLLTGPLSAAVQVADVFANHMVLQREVPIPVSGTRAAGETVTVRLLAPNGATQAEAVDAAAGLTTWSVTLPAQLASTVGAPLALQIVGTNELLFHTVQIGDVWLCSGQSNMNFLMGPYLPFSEGVLDYESEIAAANDPGIAVFNVIPEANDSPLDGIHGAWRPNVPLYARYFSAVPYLYGRALRRDLGVPIGIIVSALGATSIKSWSDYPSLAANPAATTFLSLHAGRVVTFADAIAAHRANDLGPYRAFALEKFWAPNYAPSYPEPEGYPTWRYQPAGLFHGMVAPLATYPVRGFVWYQGEGDSTDHANYARYLQDLIAGWRAAWGGAELPFLVVQLANYDPVGNGGDPSLNDTWAFLREAQLAAVDAVPGAGLAVSADVGSSTTIHPRDKKTVAERLALLARQQVYGETTLVASGPRFEAMAINGATVTLSFTQVGGDLVLDSTRATGGGPSFQLAGADGIFHDATPILVGGKVELTATAVPLPRQVRYGFHNDPKLILYNTEGLPAAPFRTGLTVGTLARWEFTGSSVSVTTASDDVSAAALEYGPGVGTTGLSTQRGNPIPSLFLRADATPASEAAAVATGSYVSLRVTPVNAHGWEMGGASVKFDIARSTTIAEFGYAVRSSQDNFGANRAAATITAANETFVAVEASLDGPGLPLGEAVEVRIYVWDGTSDSSRVVRFDNLEIRGRARYEPGLTIAPLAANDAYALSWAGVEGRSYRVQGGDTLANWTTFPVLAQNLACDASGRLHHEVLAPADRAFFTVSEMP